MKNNLIISKTALYAFLISSMGFGFASCNNSPKKEDSKEIAEEHNDAKFDERKDEKDAEFLVEVAEINLEEIQLGQLAQSKSKLAEVKALGKMMEDEHTKVMNDLKGLAANKQITIPTTLTEDGKDAYKKLSDKTGKDFDREYCDMMVKGHKKAIEKFEKAAENRQDADIKAWAASMLPNLRNHLDHAIRVEDKLK